MEIDWQLMETVSRILRYIRGRSVYFEASLDNWYNYNSLELEVIIESKIHGDFQTNGKKNR